MHFTIKFERIFFYLKKGPKDVSKCIFYRKSIWQMNKYLCGSQIILKSM